MTDGRATQIEMPDECSGISVLPDGRRVYWTEGRSTYLTVKHTDGRLEELSVSLPESDEIRETLRPYEEGGFDEYRQATAEEIQEWKNIRGHK